MFFKLFTRSPSLLWSSHSQFFNLVQLKLISKRKFLLEIITYLLPLWLIKAHPPVFSSQGKVPEKRLMNYNGTILGKILQSWWLASHGFAVLDGKLYSRSASMVETMDILFMCCWCFFVLAVQASTLPLQGMDQRLIWLVGAGLRRPKRPRQPPIMPNFASLHLF